MIGWTTGGRVQKSSARKVTHHSTILALGALTLEFPWDPMSCRKLGIMDKNNVGRFLGVISKILVFPSPTSYML